MTSPPASPDSRSLPPASVLIAAAGVPADLVELGAQLRASNRDAVVARWELWHAVLPIDDVDSLLDQPWDASGSPARRVCCAQRHGRVVRVRTRDLEDGVMWWEDATPMSMTQNARRGGAGRRAFGSSCASA
jgi:hypothetical protein